MLFAGFLFAASVMQATSQDDGSFWVTRGLHNVFRDTPVATGDITKIIVSAAKGQTVGAQVVIRAGKEPVVVGKVTCAVLRTEDGASTISPQGFSWAFVEYYPVTKNSTATPVQELLRQAPADFPDAFSEATELTVQPGQNQPIWVQFRVPSTAAAGTYSGMLSVIADGDPIQMPVELTVYDFAFPSSTRLLVTIWTNTDSLAKHQNVSQDSDAWWPLLDRVAALMQAHHQNVILTPWSLIRASIGEDGKLTLDFTRFDRWVRTFLARGFKRIEISHMGGREHGQWEDKTFVASDMPCENKQTGKSETLPLEKWLPLLQAHLKERGWLDRSMIHVADEPIEVNLESWKQLSKRVRNAAPAMKRIDAVHVPDLSGYLETWVPQLNYLEQWIERFTEAQKRGAELWYYTAWVPQGRYPNRLMDYALLKTRVLHWLNYTSGTTGYLHWGWNFWDVPFDQFAPGDNFIVWPGKTTPRSSLRYEAMREGIEDYEYLCLLEEAVGAAGRRVGAQGLNAREFAMGYARMLAPTFQDYSRSMDALYATRDAVAQSIVSLRARIPAAARARRIAGDIEVRGFAPPGAMVAVGETQAPVGRDGMFTLGATVQGTSVDVVVSVGSDTVTLKTPIVQPER